MEQTNWDASTLDFSVKIIRKYINRQTWLCINKCLKQPKSQLPWVVQLRLHTFPKKVVT